jgi:membrane protein DedA with SNARE-associated domain
MTHLLLNYGLALLFVAVAIESAGIPIPGETALITAAFLASQGHYGIVWVIVVAAAGAIVGDNIGYWIGREAGRRVLERWSFVSRYADRALPPAERFFERHGPKAVFIARFVAVLRVTAAWVAGISRMHWWKFAIWNAAGGIAWATLVGLIAYYVGKSAADAISRYGLYAAGGLILLGALSIVVVHFARKRMVDL